MIYQPIILALEVYNHTFTEILRVPPTRMYLLFTTGHVFTFLQPDLLAMAQKFEIRRLPF